MFTFLTLTLDTGKLSASRPGDITLEERIKTEWTAVERMSCGSLLSIASNTYCNHEAPMVLII
jgi:hypothetical protein